MTCRLSPRFDFRANARARRRLISRGMLDSLHDAAYILASIQESASKITRCHMQP